jgi:hypothetical protein
MSKLFTGYIIARRETEKRRRLFVDASLEIACTPMILIAESGAEANAIAYADLIQRLPVSDGWVGHDAQMFAVPDDAIRAALDDAL